jgi:adenylate cyclase
MSLRGGVRRDGNSIRITAQLIDAENGIHLWAERFDRELGDMFAVQVEIARSVVAAIDPLIAQTERQRAMRKAPESLNVWDAWQRALWYWAKGGDLSVPRGFLQRAVALDPRFAPAHAMLALLHLSDAALGSDLPLRENVMRAEIEARTAMGLDPDSAIAHAVLAWVFNFQGDSKSALEEADIAIDLDPNDPQGHVVKGRILTLSGQTAAARGPLTVALRLDPRGPTAPTVMVHRVMCCYLETDYLAAEATARRAIQSYPEFSRLHAWLAAALGQLDRIDEARVMLDAVVAASPSYFKFITTSMPPFYRPEDHNHLLAGLRKAGWQG